MERNRSIFSILRELLDEIANGESVAEMLEVNSESAGEVSEDEDESLLQLRAYWFEQRVEDTVGSDSFSRYLIAVQQAESVMNAQSNLVASVAESALRMRKLGSFHAGSKIGLLLKESGLEGDTSEVKEKTDPFEFGVFGPPLTLSKGQEPSLLALHIDPTKFPDHNLHTAVFCRRDADGKIAGIVEASKFFETDRLLVGYASKPGVYQAIALPRSPLLRLALKTLFINLSRLAIEAPTLSQDGVSKGISALASGLHQLLLAADAEGLATNLADDNSANLSSITTNRFHSFLESISVSASAVDTGKTFVSALPTILRLEELRQLNTHKWEFIGPFPDEEKPFRIGRVTQIDVHPFDGNILIAATAGGGVWRTDDAGEVWKPLMQDEPSLAIGAVAFAPSNPQVIYAASGEDAGRSTIAIPGTGVYRSVDGGEKWEMVGKVASTRFSTIIVHPRESFTIYVAGNEGLHKSINGGDTWITNPGLLSLFDGPVTDVVVDHDHPDKVYMGVYNQGVFKSETGGESINGAPAFRLLDADRPFDSKDRLPSGLDANWVKLAIGRNGADRSNFLAAKLGANGLLIFTTVNGGNTWKRGTDTGRADKNEWTSLIAVHPLNQEILYAGGKDSCLFKSVDGGQSWLTFGEESHEDQQDLAFDPNNPERFYLANDGGVFLSSPDQQGTWKFVSGNLGISQVYDLDISEKDPEVILCGTQDNNWFYRNNNGKWRNQAGGDVTQVAIDPADPKIFYVSLSRGIDEAAQLRGISRTIDAGKSEFSPLGSEGITGGGSPWVTLIKLDPNPNLENPKTSRELFVCGSYRLFHSRNGGDSWQPVGDKLDNPVTDKSDRHFITEGEISALEYSIKDPLILYLGTRTGRVYRTEKGGKFKSDWELLRQKFADATISAIGIDPNDSDHVWIALSGRGASGRSKTTEGMVKNPTGISHLFKTTDGGKTWADASGNCQPVHLPDSPISSVVIDGSNNEIVYVATDVGVFRASEGGNVWHAFQDGLPRSPITELKLNNRARRLVAATMGRGVYWRELT